MTLYNQEEIKIKFDLNVSFERFKLSLVIYLKTKIVNMGHYQHNRPIRFPKLYYEYMKMLTVNIYIKMVKLGKMIT